MLKLNTGAGSFLLQPHAQVDAAQPPGILITNGEFTAFTLEQNPCGECVSNHVRVSASNTGPVKLVDSSFWGPAAANAVLFGNGSTTFVGCEFVQWDIQRGDGSPAVDQQGTGPLVVTSCDFANDKTQVVHTR